MFKAKVNEIPDKSPKGTLNSGSDGAEDFVQIDVPSDGSCLFWSVALAYLIPSKDDEVLFKERYMDLFGKEGDQDTVRKFILSEASRDGLHKNQFCKGTLANKMSGLVQKVFRAKVVEYIRSNKKDYIEQITINSLIDTKNKSYFTEGKFQKDFIKQFGASSDTNTSKLKPSTLSPQEERELIEEFNKIKDSNKVQEFKFNSYLELMSSSGAWGGHRELVAVAQMLKVRIDISRDGNCITSCGEDFNTKIQLYHVNDRTHYNFGLEKSIIDNYIRDTPKKSSPLKDIGNSPRWQDSTSHSKSPGKENTPPSSNNEKQVSSITDEESRSSSSRKRKLISSVTSEGANVKRRLDMDGGVPANLVSDGDGKKKQLESQRSGQESRSTSIDSVNANVVSTSQKSSLSQNLLGLTKRKHSAIGEGGGSPLANVAKRGRIEGKDKLLEVFVESFVEDFESMLKDCWAEVRGKKEKKPAMLLQLVSLGLVGGVVGAGVSMAGAGVVAAPIIASTALLTKKAVDDVAVGLSQVAHSNGAASVVKTTSNLQVSQSQMRKMVVETGVNIFLHYSSQYKNITCKAGDSVGMEILAKNAAARVIDYIKSQERAIQVEDPEVFLREFCTLITKGVALGSKRGIFVRLGKCMKKTTQTALERIARNQPLFALKNEDSDVKGPNVDDIYEKTGIVKITNDGNQYYVSKESDAGNYGYRIMFEWESKSELDGWEKQECPSQEWCGYTLKSEEIEKRVNEIFKKLNDKGQALRADTGAIKADTKAILNFCMEGNLTLHTKRLRKSKLKEVVSDLGLFLQLIIKHDKVEFLEFMIREGFNDKIKDGEGYDLLQLAAESDAILDKG